MVIQLHMTQIIGGVLPFVMLAAAQSRICGLPRVFRALSCFRLRCARPVHRLDALGYVFRGAFVVTRAAHINARA